MGIPKQFSEQTESEPAEQQAAIASQPETPAIVSANLCHQRSRQSSVILATDHDFVGTTDDPPPVDFRVDHLRQQLGQAGQVDWQTAMKRAIRKPSDLVGLLGLRPAPSQPVGAATCLAEAGNRQFPMFVPLEFVGRMEMGNLDDPLLRQVLVTAEESDHSDPRFLSDPVGDHAAMVGPGLLHKYAGRTLMITTGACGVHCRYCFRREYPYAENRVDPTPGPDSTSLRYLRKHKDINEVILSGGDPLTLVDDKLFQLVDQIESIGHVRRLRIHSRMPVVIPQRVTDALVQRLGRSRLAVWMVVHANHPAELDADVVGRIDRLVRGGVPVLNQAVLLRGVNDNADVLEELCQRLIDARAMPYYLHQLDRVRGAAHFEVPIQRGIELIDCLRERLPGYAVPKFVVEQPGKVSKTPL